MTLSPIIILIIYLVGLVIFIALSLMNVYHILRFSFMRRFGLVVTGAYFSITLIVVIVTLRLVADVEWQEPLELDLPSITPNSNEGFE